VESGDESTEDEDTTACTVAGPSTTASTAPASSTRHDSEERQTGPAAIVDTAGPSGSNITVRVPTLGGLQRELHDLKNIVVKLSQNQEQLFDENMMLRGSFEVLLSLKDKIGGG
jgi:hypothetical protein